VFDWQAMQLPEADYTPVESGLAICRTQSVCWSTMWRCEQIHTRHGWFSCLQNIVIQLAKTLHSFIIQQITFLHLLYNFLVWKTNPLCECWADLLGTGIFCFSFTFYNLFCVWLCMLERAEDTVSFTVHFKQLYRIVSYFNGMSTTHDMTCHSVQLQSWDSYHTQ